MSLKSKIADLKTRTSGNPITPAFHGSILDDVQKVTETVNTIADLRQYENPIDGEVVYVKGHTVEGLGGGKFKFHSGKLFSLTEAIDSTGTQQRTITALTINAGVDSLQGPKIVFDNGATARLVANTDPSSSLPKQNKDRSYRVGETAIRLTADSTAPSGSDAYFADDNGVYIRPSYAGFDSIGYWKRQLDDYYVTPPMYGAIPSETIKDPSPVDCLSALQECYDSQYDVVTTPGFYYISNTLYVRTNKRFSQQGSMHFFQSIADINVREKYKDTGSYASIWTDQNINLVEIQGNCRYEGIINCSQIPAHDKMGVRININYRITIYLEVIVIGNPDTITNTPEIGTRAVVVDRSVIEDDGTFLTGAGHLTFSTFKIAVYDCHSGLLQTEVAEGLNTYDNSLDITFLGRGIKYPIHLSGGFNVSYLRGFYQETNILWEDNSVIPVAYIGNPNGFYFDLMSHDMSTNLRHYILLDTGDTASNIDVGPNVKRAPFSGRSTERAIAAMTKSSQIDLELLGTTPILELKDLKNIPKRVIKEVTSAEILASGDTDILVLENIGGGVQVLSAVLKGFAGVDDYSTNTNMLIRANGSLPYTAGTINLGSLASINSWSYGVEITQRQGTISSSASGPTIWLTTEVGNPTGGDRSFRIIIDYLELSELD